ncbi:MAG: endopeptidase La [Gammaproteobacteria bacterium]|nr:endopeptidase La [Gammaproteobacteria bacterium]
MSKINFSESELIIENNTIPGDSMNQGLATQDEVLPETLTILPLSERPFFPSQALPILMNEAPWSSTLERIYKSENKLAGVIMTQGDIQDDLSPDDFYTVGCAVRIHSPSKSDNKLQFIVEGIRRFKIEKWLSTTVPLVAQVSYPDDAIKKINKDEIRAYALAISHTLKELVPLNPLYTEELRFFLNRFGPNNPSPLVDFAASITSATKEELQKVLEIFNLYQRLKKVLVMVKQELEVAKLQAKIHRQVEDKITDHQRKFFLREQLKEIQKELGLAKDDRLADIERFNSRIEARSLPEKVTERVNEEMNKMAVLETGSPEYSVTRNYLDVVTSLPWGVVSLDKLNIKRARIILNKKHDGLSELKERILEFIAVASLKGEIAGSNLLFVGPPGVGKTSIGRSIARALGRQFFRFSVGGMRDEAEIKGHRRTYIGAMPGKIIQAIRECGTANPVIMLDEIDKMGNSYHGDPSSALLEVLDPEQNNDFLDHYLDVRFDLSKVLFICTANQLDTIPSPLLDRMEVHRLSGYITEEKVEIAKHHLWPRQRKKSGLKASQIKLSDAAIKAIIENYAREAGVRNLEKQLAKIVRKVAVRIVKKQNRKLVISTKTLEAYLGKPIFNNTKPRLDIGLITGLAWTTLGGVPLTIEATCVPSKQRGFKYTGQLGSVMKESAELAYSYILANMARYGGHLERFDRSIIHLHVPEGATPKDGPSAGITIATALLSLAKNKKIGLNVAMTGELTLSGDVFPVGGIREKVIAARRAKLKNIILPAQNQRDYEELPSYIQNGLHVHFVSHFSEVVKIVYPK